MSNKKDKKKEEFAKGVKKHQDNIMEMLGGTEIIDSYIDAASERSDVPISDDQKNIMKTWTMELTSKWSEVLYKMEEALKDPEVVKELNDRIANGALHKKGK